MMNVTARGPLGRWMVVTMMLLLAGCGWHLRGSGPGASLEGVEVYAVNDGASGAVADQVRTGLVRAGAALADTPTAADAILVLMSEASDRQAVSVDRNVNVTEYELRYRVQYRIEGPDGNVLVPPQEITSARAYEFNPNDVLGSRTREDQLLEELRIDAVRLLLTRLQAVLR